jgi:hypothetical protein
MVVLQLWVPVSPGEGSASVVHSSPLLWCLLSSRTFLVWVLLSIISHGRSLSLSWWRPSSGSVAVHAPCSGAWVACMGAHPCFRRATPAINSAGQANQQRQEETEQEGVRGQSPLHRGLGFVEIKLFSRTIVNGKSNPRSCAERVPIKTR